MLNELSMAIHDNAVRHGWWDEERSFGDIVALCHSELSEALEEYRENRPMVWHYKAESSYSDGLVTGSLTIENETPTDGSKPEGIAVEMIDCIIRILDWCGKENIDVDKLIELKHEYNKTRPYRHGGKKL